MSGSLPSFEEPPVVEVALGLHFDPLTGLTPAHLGLFWSEIRTTYTTAGQRSQITPIVETPQATTQTQLVALDGQGNQQALPCAVFTSADGSRVVQLQQDLLVHNWRQAKSGYPRYPSIRDEFARVYELFLAFLAKEGLGEPIARQSDVTYVNHIETASLWERHGDLDKVVTVWSNGFSDQFLSQPDDVQFHSRHQITDHAGEFFGRLHFDLRPASGRDGAPILALTVTGRGKPADATLAAVVSAMNLERENVVKGFRSITTDAMHKLWGEYE